MNDHNQRASARQAIFFFLRRHSGVHAFLAAVGLLVGVLEAVNLAVFIPMLDYLVGAMSIGAVPQNKSTLLGVLNSMLSWISASNPFVAAAALLLVLTIVKGGLSIFHEYVVARASGDILHQYRCKLMNEYKHAPLSFFDENRTGGLVYNLTTPPVKLSQLLYIVPRALVDLLRFLAVLLLLFYVEPLITVAIIVLGLITYLLFARRLSSYTYRLASIRRTAESAMSGLATEWIRGVRPIRIAGAERYWISGFEKNSAVARSSYVQTSAMLASPRHVFEMISFLLFFAALIVFYLIDASSFRAHIATLGLFAVGLVRVLPSVAALTRAPLDVRNVLPDVEFLYSRFRKGERDDTGGSVPYRGLSGRISFDNVSVSFPDRGRVLDGISLAIPKNAVVAFVGPSGAGKSTLLNTIIGVQSASEGSVDYDGVDIHELDKNSLMLRMGYVGQDVILFKGSVRENISFFREDVSPERVREVAVIAEIAEFIESLPDGYDTQIGESGANLSGGQAQRLAIARALVNDPEILVLDEATSALDSSSEKAVIHSLQRAAENRTVIMVTHKLSSARWVDNIFVLDRGKLLESGNWATLLADKNGLFYRLCKEQHLVDSDASLNIGKTGKG